jgi:nitrogen fixation protein FixH
MSSKPSRPFTGGHLAALLLLFFATVIAINSAMAVIASRSWSGFVVRNSYVASQEFNRRVAEARDQAALGWSGRLSLAAGRLRYELRDARGKLVDASHATASFRRPVSDREDRVMALPPSKGGPFETDVTLADGIWIIEFEIDAGLAYPYRDTRRVHIADGAIQ